MKQLPLFQVEPAEQLLPAGSGAAFIHMVSIDPERNRARFYTISWQGDLWGAGTIATTWGRIGGRGRTHVTPFDSREALGVALLKMVARRMDRGYRLA
jgi:predicted DNA-binding WGR domain protein